MSILGQVQVQVQGIRIEKLRKITRHNSQDRCWPDRDSNWVPVGRETAARSFCMFPAERRCWVFALLLRNREAQGSNHGPQTGYPDWGGGVPVFRSPSRSKRSDRTSKLGYDHFLLHCFLLIIHLLSFDSVYSWQLKVSFNKPRIYISVSHCFVRQTWIILTSASLHFAARQKEL